MLRRKVCIAVQKSLRRKIHQVGAKFTSPAHRFTDRMHRPAHPPTHRPHDRFSEGAPRPTNHRRRESISPEREPIGETIACAGCLSGGK
eukprot:8686343-Pyramimonas_sp.AAC.2